MSFTGDVLTDRIPTFEEYLAYKGAHCHNLWRDVGPAWVCPACKRTRYQIMRWTERYPGKPHAFYGWMAGLHRHHDHSRSYVALSAEHPRFPETVICDQCNAADGAAKRMLKLPTNFSFSPQEIAQFIQAKPHAKHSIDKLKALELYRASLAAWAGQ